MTCSKVAGATIDVKLDRRHAHPFAARIEREARREPSPQRSRASRRRYVRLLRVHKALVDSLGVKKLVAVAGASGGSVQAMEWGALYPGFVDRVIHVIGPGFDIHPFVIGLMDAWVAAIKVDPKWNGGDYYGRDEPLDGIAKSLALVTITARAHGWAERTFGYKWADPAKKP